MTDCPLLWYYDAVSCDGEDVSQRPVTSLDADAGHHLSVEKMSPWCQDSLEAVLRRRIIDLEEVERHLRRQVLNNT